MDYYIKGDAANADKIKAAFKAKGIDTASNSLDHDEFLYYSSNGLLYFEDFSITLLNVFKTNPGYRELELPVEHKFKAEDWIVSTRDPSLTCRILETNIPNKLGKFGYKVETFSDGIYEKTCLISSDKMDEWGRLWTISDAKDGDVLVDEDTNTIGIFKKIYGICWHSKIYCGKSTYNTMVYHQGGSHEIKFTKPATKEQRDLLFAKLREAGYTWDEKKKELKKIQPHYDISNFYAGMPVLVRDGDCHEWRYVTFSHYRKVGTPFCAGGQYWYQCIPFNEKTKHLLGTTGMCAEEFINWVI